VGHNVWEPIYYVFQRLQVLTHFCAAAVTYILTIGFFLPFAAAKGDDAAGLLEKSQKLVEHPGHAAEALTLVKQADDMLQRTAPLSAERGRVLDEYAYLLMLQATESAQQTDQISAATMADWRIHAEPITKQALLAVRTAADSQQADVALALEMEAEALGRTPQAKRLWEKSTQIRKRLVESLMNGKDGRPDPSYCDDAGKPVASPPSAIAGPDASAVFEAVASFAFVVGKDGRPIKIRLLRAVGFGHDEEGAKTLSCWRFKPGTQSGQPVSVPSSADIKYRVFWPPVMESKPGDKRQHSETVTPQLSK